MLGWNFIAYKVLLNGIAKKSMLRQVAGLVLAFASHLLTLETQNLWIG